MKGGHCSKFEDLAHAYDKNIWKSKYVSYLFDE